MEGIGDTRTAISAKGGYKKKKIMIIFTMKQLYEIFITNNINMLEYYVNRNNRFTKSKLN